MSTHRATAVRFAAGAWLAFAVLPAHGEAPIREQFAHAISIEMTSNAPVQRLELPFEVYRAAVHPALDDVRVLNGNGEVVPFALRRPPAETRRESVPQALPFFPLRGDPAAAVAALRLSIAAGGAALEVQGESATDRSAAISAYLLDATGIDDDIDSLHFEWPDDAPDFSASAVLEVSNDLGAWRPIVSNAPLARLRHEGRLFESGRIAFPATRARYWRLRAAGERSLPIFAKVSAHAVAGPIPAARRSREVAGVSLPDKPGEYRFDLGAELPVDRLELVLPESNTVAEIELSARRDGAADWRHIARTSVYRLSTPGEELRAPPLSVSTDAARHWRVVVNLRGGGLGSGVPRLRAAWLPHQVVFVTRGAGPFELVYGNFAAKPADVALDALLPPGALAPGNDLANIPLATAGEPRVAGGPARLIAPPPAPPGRQWILWAALAAGVCTLAVIAWKLSRQMRVSS